MNRPTNPRRLLLGALTLALLAISSCAGGSASRTELDQRDGAHHGGTHTAVPPVSALSEIPSPGALDLQPRRASYPPQELTQLGFDMDLALPNQKAQQYVNFDTGLLEGAFEPTNTAGGDFAIGQAAFAMYRFSVPDYNEELKVWSYFAETTPPAASTVFIGVANWWENRWDWYPWQETRPVPELAAHKRDDGTIVVTVLDTAGDPLELTSVAVGARYHMRALIFFSGDSLTVPVGTEISFIAEAFFAGVLDNVEWDLDGDGVYEVTGASVGSENSVPHTFNTEGAVDIHLRISGNDGVGGPEESDTETTQVTVTPVS